MSGRRLGGADASLAAERQGQAGPDLHWLTLAFHDEALESAFRREYVERSRRRLQVSLLLGIALYAAFGGLDPYIVPEAKRFAWFIRYAVVCPTFGAVLLLSRTRSLDRFREPVLAGLGVLAGAGIVAMTWRAAAPGNYLYYAGLMLVCAYVYTFFPLRFLAATAASWAVVALYEATALGASRVPTPVVVNNTVFLASVNVIGMSACYAMERSLRVDFFQRRVIERQAEELRSALADVKALTGLLPICAWCKRVRDDGGYWSQIEEYLHAHSDATFSHGICPDCLEKLRADDRA